MSRGKLQLQLIRNEKARRKHFEKKKRSLEKAAKHLSTLCGVDIGMIVYGPAHCKDSDQPTIWPSNQEVLLADLIKSYKARLCHEGRHNTYSLTEFFKDKTEKVEDELKKLRLYNCTSLEDLKRFHGGLMAKICAVRRRINLMKGSTSLFTKSNYSESYYPVQGSGVLAPSVQKYEQPDFGQVQQQPNFVYYSGSQSNTENYQMNYGGVSTGSMYRFNENPSNYAYGFGGNGVQFQDCGFGTGTMEKVVNAEPLMSYKVPNVHTPGYFFMPNVVQMPGNEQMPVEWFLNEES